VGQRGSPRRPKSESWDSLQFEVVKESTDQIEVKAHLLNKKARYSSPSRYAKPRNDKDGPAIDPHGKLAPPQCKCNFGNAFPSSLILVGVMKNKVPYATTFPVTIDLLGLDLAVLLDMKVLVRFECVNSIIWELDPRDDQLGPHPRGQGMFERT